MGMKIRIPPESGERGKGLRPGEAGTQAKDLKVHETGRGDT
jgi:hypothetical protein